VRKGGSKNKGSSFEREIAVELSKWISGGKREDLLWRSSQSGGRSTTARKKGTILSSQAGDLSAIHPLGQPFINLFYTELKFYRDLQYAGITDNTGYLVKFWQSTIIEANSYKRSPLLIAKQNRKPAIVFTHGLGLKMLGLSQNKCIISSPKLGLFGYLFDEFVKLAKPL
jgi:hypothetical protein